MNPLLRKKDSQTSNHPPGLSSLLSPRVLVQSVKSITGKNPPDCKEPRSNGKQSVDMSSVDKGILVSLKNSQGDNLR
jgi:hypothetical protein